MKTQSDDEFTHAQKIIHHILERDQQVVLPPIQQPPTEWSSPVAILEESLRSEQRVSESINNLYELAGNENDRAAQIMLQWFVNEQVEEENVARAILGRLRLAGDSGVGLLMVDQEMASGRVPGAMSVPPAQGE
jgi:ferritin